MLTAATLAFLGLACRQEGGSGQDGDGAPQGGGEPPVVVVPETVVTVTRLPEASFLAPQSVTSVTAEDATRRLPQNLPDLLAEEPGLVMQRSNQGGGSPVLRGRTGKDVLLLIDGQRFNNATFRRNHQYLNTVDAFALERVEVVRGPTSVLYGSDAIGGAVNLIPRRRDPDGEGLHGRWFGQYETANRGVVGHVDAGVDLRGFGLLGGFTWRDFDHLEAGRVGDPVGAVDVDGVQDPSAYRERDLHLSVTRRLGEHDHLDLTVFHNRQSDVPASDRVIPNDDQPVPPDLLREFDPQLLRWLSLTFRHEDPAAAVESVRVTASVNAPVEGRRIVKTSDPDTLLRERDELTAPGLSAQAGIRWADRHRLVVGAEGYYEMLQSERERQDLTTGATVEDPNGRFPDDSNYWSAGVFAEDQWDVADDWRWTNGVRGSRVHANVDFDGLVVGALPPFGRFSEDFEDVTFATGLTWFATATTSLYAAVAKGFRAPNLDDLAVDADFASGNRIPNFDLEPEKVYSVEVGAHRFSGRTRGGGAVAVASYTDLLTNQLAFNLGGVDYFQVQNASRARIWSAEAWGERTLVESAGQAPRQTLFAQAFASFGRDLTFDEPVGKIPPPEALVGWRLEEGQGRWTAEAFARGALEQDRLSAADAADPRIPAGGTPAWITFNLRGGVALRPDAWLGVALENVFNQRYRVHGSGLDAPGRNLVVSLTLTF